MVVIDKSRKRMGKKGWKESAKWKCRFTTKWAQTRIQIAIIPAPAEASTMA
jgi:hypothetical protein